MIHHELYEKIEQFIDANKNMVILIIQISILHNASS